MFKFYLRAAMTVAAATVLTLILLRGFVVSPVEDVNLSLLHGHLTLHAKRVAEIPPPERRAAVQQLSQVLGYPVQMEQNSGIEHVRAQWRGGDLYMVAAVPETPGQLAFGPLPYQRPSELPLTVLLTVLVSFAVAWIGLRPLASRIRVLQVASARMCKGDFSVRVSTEPDEFMAGIGSSLNQLADRIGQLLSDERDLLRTVAHEVRAPISRMRFRVERIHERVPSDLGKDARGLVADLQQVDSLFEELLTYVAFDEFDSERPALQTGPIDVGASVRRVVEEVTATEKAIPVEVRGGDGATVVGNAKLFDRAVTNLLLNALAYGGPKVTVFIRNFERECVIDVQDSGPGIPELDRPKVVKPFVRLASKKTRGTGLGLAIVTRIMNLHSGKLHIVDAPTGGASIQLVWRNSSHGPDAGRPFLLKWLPKLVR